MFCYTMNSSVYNNDKLHQVVVHDLNSIVVYCFPSQVEIFIRVRIF